MKDRPVALACGMGTNTLGLLFEMVRRGMRIDLILFGDTGGEFPRVYEMIPLVSAWLVERGYPEIIVVRHTRADGGLETLEEECLRTRRLPSIAYGSSRLCSGKYKLGPQDKFMNHWAPALETWERRERVVKLIGYDVDERHRIDRGDQWNDERYLQLWRDGMSVPDIARHFLGDRPHLSDSEPQGDLFEMVATVQLTKIVERSLDDGFEKAFRSLCRKITATVRFEKIYPLVEWGWGRQECIESIRAAGMPLPGKTACFFCPSSKLHEIRSLPAEFAARALAIEDGAQDGLTSVRGLGRSFAWRDVLYPRQKALDLAVPPSLPCECVDGEPDDDETEAA